MRLRKCEWASCNDCVWRKRKMEKPHYFKKYRIGHRKAIFKIKLGNRYYYGCEGCVREIFGEGHKALQKEIAPLTKKAERVLLLLKL